MAKNDVSGEAEFYEPELGNLLWHVRLTERAMERTLRRMITGTGITKAQFGVMQVLRSVRQASSAGLARMLSVSPQAMVDIVADLETKGYLQRESVTSSAGRMITAQLTRSGKAAFAKAADRFEQLDKRFDAEFDDEERADLIALLERMRTVFDGFADDLEPRGR
jgi:DNA-binding MarR family transcriptional regulator